MLQEMSAHNRRPRRHTAKTSPTVADGKARAAATGTAKILFAVCQKSGTRKTFLPCVYIGARRKKAGRRRHGQLTASAAVRRVLGRQAHGNTPRFAVCPDGSHTATLPDSPCARTAGTRQCCQIRRVPLVLAHGELWSVRRVHGLGTRRTWCPGLAIWSFCRVPSPWHTAK